MNNTANKLYKLIVEKRFLGWFKSSDINKRMKRQSKKKFRAEEKKMIDEQLEGEY